MKIKGKKATISITLEPELVEKARKYGLNLSKVTENALNDMISRIEGTKHQEESNSGSENPDKTFGAGGGTLTLIYQ